MTTTDVPRPGSHAARAAGLPAEDLAAHLHAIAERARRHDRLYDAAVLDEAGERIRNAAALHGPEYSLRVGGLACAGCGRPWPCPTRLAVDCPPALVFALDAPSCRCGAPGPRFVDAEGNGWHLGCYASPQPPEPEAAAPGDVGMDCPCGGRMLDRDPGSYEYPRNIACTRCGRAPVTLTLLPEPPAPVVVTPADRGPWVKVRELRPGDTFGPIAQQDGYLLTVASIARAGLRGAGGGVRNLWLVTDTDGAVWQTGGQRLAGDPYGWKQVGTAAPGPTT